MIWRLARAWLGVMWSGGICFGATLMGEIETAEGKRYAGQIELGEAGLKIWTEKGTNRVEWAELRHLRCQPGAMEERREGLLGVYFDNKDFTGRSNSRLDRAIDFNWGNTSPIQGVAGRYSARWTGTLTSPMDGRCTFILESDDGSRLRIGERWVIDQWTDGDAHRGVGSIELKKGERYPLLLEYFQSGGEGRIKLSWQPAKGTDGSEPGPEEILTGKYLIPPEPETVVVPGEGAGLEAYYYQGTELGGVARLRRDATIDFDWGGSEPLPGLGSDRFSVRWLGRLKIKKSEPYSFIGEGDDGIRVWLNEVLILESWPGGKNESRSKPLFLEKGSEHRLQVEYCEHQGNARVKLKWTGATTPEQVLPADQLSPSTRGESRRMAGGAGSGINGGVVLSGGSVIVRPVKEADSTSLRFDTARRGDLSLVNVARIILQPVSAGGFGKLVEGRSGLLLQNDDFIDGDLRSLDSSRVRIDSVLFGVRSFERSRVRAIVLREVEERGKRWEVRSRDGSLLLGDGLRVEGGSVRFSDSTLEKFEVPMADLAEMTARD